MDIATAQSTTLASVTTTLPPTTGLVPLPGETGADLGLQGDVLEMLLGLEAGSGCDDSLVTDTRIVDMGSDRAEEEWLIDRCGVIVPWTVEFRGDESGEIEVALYPSAEVSSLEFLVDAGGWEGITSQGEELALVLEDRGITLVVVGFENPTCPDDSPMSIQKFGTPEHYLVGNTFAFVSRSLYNLTITGAFRDDYSAMGTLRIEPPLDCGAIIEATWEATPAG